MLTEEKKLIGTKQAGDILGYSSAYVRQLCANKQIRIRLDAQKMGRDWLLDQEKVEQFAEEKKKKKKKKKLLN